MFLRIIDEQNITGLLPQTIYELLKRGKTMVIKRTCKTCFHKTSHLCNGYGGKCDLYEIDYQYFNRLYTRAKEQATKELKEEFFVKHSMSVYQFIEKALG